MLLIAIQVLMISPWRILWRSTQCEDSAASYSLMHPQSWYGIKNKPPPPPLTTPLLRLATSKRASLHRKTRPWRSRRRPSCGCLMSALCCSVWEIWGTGTSDLPSGEPFLSGSKRRQVFGGFLQYVTKRCLSSSKNIGGRLEVLAVVRILHALASSSGRQKISPRECDR